MGFQALEYKASGVKAFQVAHRYRLAVEAVIMPCPIAQAERARRFRTELLIQ